MIIDVQASYRWIPEYYPILVELRRKEDLTREDRQLKEYLTYCHTNFLLDGLRG